MGKTPFFSIKEICPRRCGQARLQPRQTVKPQSPFSHTRRKIEALLLGGQTYFVRQSVKLRSVVLKPQSPFRASKKIVGSECGQAYFVRQSVKPQIPFCTKRKVVAQLVLPHCVPCARLGLKECVPHTFFTRKRSAEWALNPIDPSTVITVKW